MALQHLNYVTAEIKNQIDALNLPSLHAVLSPRSVSITQSAAKVRITNINCVFTQGGSVKRYPDILQGSDWVAKLEFRDVEEGDQVQFVVNGNLISLTVPPNLPPASSRHFVAVERNIFNPDNSRLISIDPKDATSIPVPAFDVGDVQPTAGQVIGQAYYCLSTVRGMVWDGMKWLDLAPSNMKTYASRQALNADTSPAAGSYAKVNGEIGFYIKTTTGWSITGTVHYNTYNDMIADTSQMNGTVGVLDDEETIWQWDSTSNSWLCMTQRAFNTLAELQAWTPSNFVSVAKVLSDNTEYIYSNGMWLPRSNWLDTESNILSSTNRLAGQIAIATDTGHSFIYTGSRWLGAPIHHFATEAELLASNAVDGSMGWSDENNLVFLRSNGNWVRNTAPEIFVSDTPSSVVVQNDLWWDTSNGGVLKFRDGSNWVKKGYCFEQGSGVPTATREPGTFYEDISNDKLYFLSAADNDWKEIIPEDEVVPFYETRVSMDYPSRNSQSGVTLDPVPQRFVRLVGGIWPTGASFVPQIWAKADNGGRFTNWGNHDTYYCFVIDANGTTPRIITSRPSNSWTNNTGATLSHNMAAKDGEFAFFDILLTFYPGNGTRFHSHMDFTAADSNRKICTLEAHFGTGNAKLMNLSGIGLKTGSSNTAAYFYNVYWS